MEIISRIDLYEIVNLLEEVGLSDEWKSCISAIYSDFGISFGDTPSLTFKQMLVQYGTNPQLHDSVSRLCIRIAMNMLPDNLPDNTIGYCSGGNMIYEMFLFKSS